MCIDYRRGQQQRWNKKEYELRKYHQLREAEVESSRQYFTERMAQFGRKLLNVREHPTFCSEVLVCAPFQETNIRVFEDCRFEVPGSNERLPPLRAIEAHEGITLCYIGISGQHDRSERPLQYVANKLYNGYKTKARQDGWQCHYLFDLVDPNFDERRYNMAWAERHLQLFVKQRSDVNVVWDYDEPAPIYGENRSGLPDHGFIGLYVCLKFA